MFEDAIYPDNPKRRRRVEEVLDNINHFAFTATTDYKEITREAREITETWVQMLKDKSLEPPPLKEIRIDKDLDVTFPVFELLGDLLSDGWHERPVQW